jgi:hypothetical protein
MIYRISLMSLQTELSKNLFSFAGIAAAYVPKSGKQTGNFF